MKTVVGTQKNKVEAVEHCDHASNAVGFGESTSVQNPDRQK